MENQALLFELLKGGKVVGYATPPRMVETVVSRVFIFDLENTVLKFYKRDNAWWNSSMHDISHGSSRIDFIRQDFAFNQFLNPKIYLALKKATLENDQVIISEPREEDDDLVIIMKKQDPSSGFTEMLFSQSCTLEEYTSIGKALAQIKLSIPRMFLPAIETNWYEQMQARMKDLAEWVGSVKGFPAHLTEQALAYLRKEVEAQKSSFQKMTMEKLVVCIDGHSENLTYDHRSLSFMDAYPPKDEWRIGSFDIDIFRTGSDIYAFVGKEAYDAYLQGVKVVAADHLQMHLADFYLLYAAMIMSPYFMMLSESNPTYKAKAEKYLSFVDSLLESRISPSESSKTNFSMP